MRVGIGYDVHAFDATRTLVLAGVTIEGHPGLAGWSDADVVVHSVIDAMLGAAANGDIGSHFPEESVPEGSSSLELLARTVSMLASGGYRVANVDCVVVVQDVVLRDHRRVMEERLAAALGIERGNVSVKATTTDRLGFIGRGEGIAGMAVVLLESS